MRLFSVYNTIQYNTIQYNYTIQYNTIKYNTIQYKSIIQYNTIQYKTLRPIKQFPRNTDLLVSLLFSSEGAVSFLPEELPGPQERLGMFELPSNDVAPLVKLDR